MNLRVELLEFLRVELPDFNMIHLLQTYAILYPQKHEQQHRVLLESLTEPHHVENGFRVYQLLR